MLRRDPVQGARSPRRRTVPPSETSRGGGESCDRGMGWPVAGDLRRGSGNPSVEATRKRDEARPPCRAAIPLEDDAPASRRSLDDSAAERTGAPRSRRHGGAAAAGATAAIGPPRTRTGRSANIEGVSRAVWPATRPCPAKSFVERPCPRPVRDGVDGCGRGRGRGGGRGRGNGREGARPEAPSRATRGRVVVVVFFDTTRAGLRAAGTAAHQRSPVADGGPPTPARAPGEGGGWARLPSSPAVPTAPGGGAARRCSSCAGRALAANGSVVGVRAPAHRSHRRGGDLNNDVRNSNMAMFSDGFLKVFARESVIPRPPSTSEPHGHVGGATYAHSPGLPVACSLCCSCRTWDPWMSHERGDDAGKGAGRVTRNRAVPRHPRAAHRRSTPRPPVLCLFRTPAP